MQPINPVKVGPGRGPLPEHRSEHEERSGPRLHQRVGAAVAAASAYLLERQDEDGHWCGELEGDTILESEYVLALHFLGRSHEDRARKAAEYLRRNQLEDGGWAIYPGGPPEVSASVKAYFVLKLAGDDPQAPHMRKAREVILRLGGIEATNSFTRIYLSIFGQYDWMRSPAVPPEMILLPQWLPFNVYEMSSWSRSIVVPLSVIWAHRPHCPVPDGATIEELYAEDWTPPERLSGVGRGLWARFFLLVDRLLKVAEKVPVNPLRRRALARCEAWILRHLEKSDGIGAIFPPIVNTLIALRCLGYPLDHPVVQEQMDHLEKLEIEEDDTLRVQPCLSPVWDTALALNALLEGGLSPDHPAARRAVGWLLDREVRGPGDWQVKLPEVPPAGWYFEYANEFYPDCDDTAEVLTALAKAGLADPEIDSRRRAAIDRGLRWLLAMQNRDGGWGAFDRECNREILTYIPFADHNAMIDPSCEDITGRILETLHQLAFPEDHPVVRRAVGFLRSTQEDDGSWYGRWGANYLYGTWLAVTGLARTGVDPSDDAMRRAREWLLAHQNPDGGWGETLASYDDPSLKGQGESTAAQTAWALLGLFATGARESEAVRRGIQYLLDTQLEDGCWYDEAWTATGFPRVFYLRYHLYAAYFPLLALADFQRGRRPPEESWSVPPKPLSNPAAPDTER